MNALERKLQYVPYGTPEHEKLVKEIQKGLKTKDFILCTDGLFSKSRDTKMDKNTLAFDVIEHDSNVFSSSKYRFVARSKAEYNLAHRQMNVGLLIIDNNNNVLTLQKNNKYLSLVGGHSDFHKNSYTMTVGEILHANMCKELQEEVKYDGALNVPELPQLFITEGETIYDFFHAWYIYIIRVDDLNTYKFKSNEKDKHSTKIMKIEDVLSFKDDIKVKNSLWQSLNMYVKTKGIKFTPDGKPYISAGDMLPEVNQSDDIVGKIVGTLIEAHV